MVTDIPGLVNGAIDVFDVDVGIVDTGDASEFVDTALKLVIVDVTGALCTAVEVGVTVVARVTVADAVAFVAVDCAFVELAGTSEVVDCTSMVAVRPLVMAACASVVVAGAPVVEAGVSVVVADASVVL